MIVDMVDSSLSLGTVELSAGGPFGNELFLGAGSADRMNIAIDCTAAGAGGTSVQLKLQGADAAGAGSWTDILLTPPILTANLKSGKCIANIPVPPEHGYKCLRINAVVVGTYTAGTLRAQLDTFIGA